MFDSGEAVAAAPDLDDPACLVLDYRLPGIDGLSLLDRLRARGLSCPCVLITTHPNRSVRARVSDAGAVLIEKPLLCDSLTAAIRVLIETPPRPS